MNECMTDAAQSCQVLRKIKLYKNNTDHLQFLHHIEGHVIMYIICPDIYRLLNLIAMHISICIAQTKLEPCITTSQHVLDCITVNKIENCYTKRTIKQNNFKTQHFGNGTCKHLCHRFNECHYAG